MQKALLRLAERVKGAGKTISWTAVHSNWDAVTFGKLTPGQLKSAHQVAEKAESKLSGKPTAAKQRKTAGGRPVNLFKSATSSNSNAAPPAATSSNAAVPATLSNATPPSSSSDAISSAFLAASSSSEGTHLEDMQDVEQDKGLDDDNEAAEGDEEDGGDAAMEE
jgi:hypothetical protein